MIALIIQRCKFKLLMCACLLIASLNAQCLEIDSNTPYFGIKSITDENNKDVSFDILNYDNKDYGHLNRRYQELSITFLDKAKIKGFLMNGVFGDYIEVIGYDYNGIFGDLDAKVKKDGINFYTETNIIKIKSKSHIGFSISYIEPIFY